MRTLQKNATHSEELPPIRSAALKVGKSKAPAPTAAALAGAVAAVQSSKTSGTSRDYVDLLFGRVRSKKSKLAAKNAAASDE